MSTPAARAAAIERALVERLGREKGVLSVALMGSFAKGNPSYDASREAFTSDLDALAVVSATRYPRFVLRQRAIAASLEATLGLPVSIAPLTPSILAQAPASVWFAEVRFGGRTIHGPDLLGTIPIPTPADVSPTEGVVVALNYLQELARLRFDGAAGNAASVAKASRALLGAGDALAAAGGFYDTSLDRRVAGVLASKALAEAAPGFVRRFEALSRESFAQRTRPQALETAAFDAWWNDARAILVSAALLSAGAREDEDASTARAKLANALEGADGPGARLSFSLLSSLHSRRPLAVLRGLTGCPANVRSALFALMADAPGAGWRNAIAPVLSDWRAASPAYTPFGQRRRRRHS